ncbi:hypothetical protein [Natronolimnobius baerhuensis]|uniref:Uncharacterized protein n=1 Tax=Natronolimnobius baerhuensis TaxID=253108 RepID=A0A202EB74_9EURY|nr:hypothetical protein [Natronolimnobius baerhuensis]OVE85220.1 hypothetical protein B2G88_10650 [Natronolimnobius baerhuensis]
MDLTQIALGVGLLAISGLAFLGSSTLDPSLIAGLTGAALLVGTGAVLTVTARDACRSRGE